MHSVDGCPSALGLLHLVSMCELYVRTRPATRPAAVLGRIAQSHAAADQYTCGKRGSRQASDQPDMSVCALRAEAMALSADLRAPETSARLKQPKRALLANPTLADDISRQSSTRHTPPPASLRRLNHHQEAHACLSRYSTHMNVLVLPIWHPAKACFGTRLSRRLRRARYCSTMRT